MAVQDSFAKLFAYNISSRPKLEISHMVTANEAAAQFYRTTPIPYERPSQGWAEFTVSCVGCGMPVKVGVASEQTTRGRIWRKRLWFAACLAAVAGTIFLATTEIWGRGIVVLAIALTFLLFLPAAFFIFAFLGDEDGVKITSKGVPQPHELKYPDGRPAQP